MAVEYIEAYTWNDWLTTNHISMFTWDNLFHRIGVGARHLPLCSVLDGGTTWAWHKAHAAPLTLTLSDSTLPTYHINISSPLSCVVDYFCVVLCFTIHRVLNIWVLCPSLVSVSHHSLSPFFFTDQCLLSFNIINHSPAFGK